MENYGEPAGPHWKAKGGTTYVVRDLTAAQAMDKQFLKSVVARIEYSNEMSEEYVIHWEIRDGEFVQSPESWQAPIFISVEDGQNFVATETIVNDDFSFRDEIAVKHSKWNMLPQSKRNGYEVHYTLRDGSVVDTAGLIEFLKKAS
jgi:hypothetical protein